MVKIDIANSEVRGLINKLIGFLGENELKRSLAKYDHAIKVSQPIYKKYYLNTHPWFSAFEEYYELEKRGKALKKHLNEKLFKLAADAKKISYLQQNMPEPVRKKYKQDLLDEKQAWSYLFEINIAWYFL